MATLRYTDVHTLISVLVTAEHNLELKYTVTSQWDLSYKFCIITQTLHFIKRVLNAGSVKSPVFQPIHIHLLLLTALLRRLLVADFPPDSLQRALLCLLHRERESTTQHQQQCLENTKKGDWCHICHRSKCVYLGEGHVCGNSCPLFGQQSLLLLGEHNLFKLELWRQRASDQHSRL